jgi:hypothetical protein
MSDRQFRIVMAFVIPLIFTIIGPYSVNDLAGWIAHGLYFLDHHEVLRSDIFSVLPTRPLIYPAFGISVIYALIYRIGGLLSVCLFHYALLMLLLWLVYRKSIFLLPNPTGKVARLATYAFWLGAVAAFGERPSMIALIPLVLAFFEISEINHFSDIRPKTVAKLCVLNILWVNIHGSFILLLAMFTWKCLFIARKRDALRPLIGLICIGASSLINPFTYHVFPFIIETLRLSQSRMISEWEPTTPFAHFPTGALYFLMCGFSIFILARRWGKPGFWSFISSPFFLLLINGAFAVRNAAIPFIVLLPTMKNWGLLDHSGQPEEDLNTLQARNVLKLTIFAGFLILVTPWIKPNVSFLLPPNRQQVFDNTAVFKIADTIRQSGKDCPIFNTWETGSFLLLTVPNKIFIDARNIIYSKDQFQEYENASQAKVGWEGYLNRYRACFAVLDKSVNTSLISAIRLEKDWRFVLEENGNVLFERIDSVF